MMLGIRRSIGVIPKRYGKLEKAWLTFHQCYSTNTEKTRNPNVNKIMSSTTTTTTKKKKKNSTSIAKIPISYIGVMADHYISPKLLRTSIIKWPKLILNKLLVFGFNTYNILKFKREISKPLQFNEWKDTSIECYVRTNKIFAQACNNLGLSPTKEVFNLINLKLNQSCGNHLIGALCTRVLNFQSQTDKKVAWDLISIDANPKVVTFNVIPDEDGVGMYVQYVMNLKTTQKLTIADRLNPNKIITETESKVDDYLVYTMNPWDGRILLVGKLFESDASRGMKSDLDVFNNSVMEKFLTESADIYREDPRKKQLNGEAT